jgi:hypothetical protein
MKLRIELLVSFLSRTLAGERVEDPCHLVGYRTRSELGVFLGHPRVRMTEELLQLLEADASLHEPGREDILEGVAGRPPRAWTRCGALHPACPLRRRMPPTVFDGSYSSSR